MKIQIFIFTIISFFGTVSAQTEIQWVEIGEGTYNIGFDYPYKIKFLIPYGTRNIPDIKEGLYPLKFKLQWLPLHLPQDKVQKIFNQQLEDKYSSEENFQLSKNLITQFLDKLPNIKKGDQWSLVYYPDRGSKLYIDDKFVHHIVGAEFNRALVQSWLNNTPVLTANLFKRLLQLK